MTFIRKIFIPFLENLTFVSKKEDSFKDWKTIVLIKLRGKTLNQPKQELSASLFQVE